MPRAAIFVGNELRFYQEAQRLQQYLLDEAGMRKHTVDVIHCWNKEPEEVLFAIGMHSAKANKQPFLLAYIGHGNDYGWTYGFRSPNQTLRVDYDEVGSELREHRGPLLLVNDCCYAGRINDEAAWFGVDGVPVGTISSCDADEASYGLMVSNIIAFWRAGKPYVPVARQGTQFHPHKEQRHGAVLDHYFFPKPA